MANVQFVLYPNFFMHLANKLIDLDTDTIKATLHTNTYAPAAADDFFNDATNELATASGYTAGGVTLTTKSIAIVAANSWTKARADSTAYAVGELVRPATGNGFVYRAAVAGTSGVGVPAFPTVVGQTVADGGVTWTCVGTNVFRFNADAISWAAPFDAGPFRHVVLWVDTAGASTTDPLIGRITYGSDVTGQSGAYTLTPDSAGGIFAIPIP